MSEIVTDIVPNMDSMKREFPTEVSVNRIVYTPLVKYVAGKKGLAHV